MSNTRSSSLPFSPQPRPEPKVVSKTLKRRAVQRMDRREKEAVRQRDRESCRVCGRRTRDVHERLFKSLGGVASLQNSLCACRTCHPLLQGHAIKVFGQTCNEPVRMQMSAATARLIFRGRAVPSHIEVLPSRSV